MPTKPIITHTGYLPDLMTQGDYEKAHEHKIIRLRLKVTDEGLEILGDSPYPHLLEDLLKALDPKEIEKMLCG